MKKLIVFAAVAAAISVIAIAAYFIRQNWGGIANGTLNTITRNVTGQDMNVNIFDNADTENGDAYNEWSMD